MSYRHATFLLTAMSAVVLLAGCSSASSETPETPENSPSAVETATPEPTVAETVFTMPSDCAGILPASRLSALDGDGLVLLGGPGGRYENDYLLEPSPEERLGGITCIWGFSDTEVSSITVSVAPLSPENRSGVVESFVAEGFNESELDGASVFGQQGDTTTEPAIINALRADSWISVIATIGGTDSYEQGLQILAETTQSVYVAK